MSNVFDKVDTSDVKKPEMTASNIDQMLSDYESVDINVEEPIQETDEKVNIFSNSKSKKRSKKVEQIQETEQATISGELISGAMFISMIDLLLPVIIVSVNNIVDKKTKIKVQDLQLKAKQKNELAPLADEVVKQLELKGNPTVLFLSSLVAIYGMNFVAVKYNVTDE